MPKRQSVSVALTMRGARSNMRERCVRAAQQGDEHELRSLLKGPRGRFLAQAEDEGRTALEVAAQQGHTGCVRLLLEHGAEPTSARKETAPYIYGACLHKYAEIVELLLLAKADPNEKFKSGSAIEHATPLHIACDGSDARATPQNVLRCVRALLQAGSQPDKADNEGHTPLMVAARHGFVGSVVALLHAKADATAVASNGCDTALRLAKSRSHTDVVHVLQRAGAEGPEQLVAAAATGDTGTVLALLRRGVPPDCKKAIRAEKLSGAPTLHMVTPLALACEQQHVDVVRLLLEHRADPRGVVSPSNVPGAAMLEVVRRHGSCAPLLELLVAALEGRPLPAHRGSEDGAAADETAVAHAAVEEAEAEEEMRRPLLSEYNRFDDDDDNVEEGFADETAMEVEVAEDDEDDEEVAVVVGQQHPNRQCEPGASEEGDMEMMRGLVTSSSDSGEESPSVVSKLSPQRLQDVCDGHAVKEAWPRSDGATSEGTSSGEADEEHEEILHVIEVHNPDTHTEDLLEALNDALGQADAGADGGGAPSGPDPARELPPLPPLAPAEGVMDEARSSLKRGGGAKKPKRASSEARRAVAEARRAEADARAAVERVTTAAAAEAAEAALLEAMTACELSAVVAAIAQHGKAAKGSDTASDALRRAEGLRMVLEEQAADDARDDARKAKQAKKAKDAERRKREARERAEADAQAAAAAAITAAREAEALHEQKQQRLREQQAREAEEAEARRTAEAMAEAEAAAAANANANANANAANAADADAAEAKNRVTAREAATAEEKAAEEAAAVADADADADAAAATGPGGGGERRARTSRRGRGRGARGSDAALAAAAPQAVEEGVEVAATLPGSGSIGRAGAEAIAVLRSTGGTDLDGLSPEQRACLSMLSLTDLSEANVVHRRELAAVEVEKEALRRESASLRQQLQQLQQRQPALEAASPAAPPPPNALAVASRLSREQRGVVLRILESRAAECP